MKLVWLLDAGSLVIFSTEGLISPDPSSKVQYDPITSSCLIGLDPCTPCLGPNTLTWHVHVNRTLFLIIFLKLKLKNTTEKAFSKFLKLKREISMTHFNYTEIEIVYFKFPHKIVVNIPISDMFGIALGRRKCIWQILLNVNNGLGYGRIFMSRLNRRIHVNERWVGIWSIIITFFLLLFSNWIFSRMLTATRIKILFQIGVRQVIWRIPSSTSSENWKLKSPRKKKSHLIEN